ncbi:hypothetical protein [Inovirus D_HF32_91]|nr:hypothetical protein [Inovirus D_HF32_91]
MVSNLILFTSIFSVYSSYNLHQLYVLVLF